MLAVIKILKVYGLPFCTLSSASSNEGWCVLKIVTLAQHAQQQLATTLTYHHNEASR